MVLVLLAGCGTQRTPDSYTGSVQRNFLKSCEAQSKNSLSNPKKTCACSYAQIKKSIPFSRFKRINSDLADKPGPLPGEMATIVDNCKANESDTTSSGAQTSGTTTTEAPASTRSTSG